LNYWIFKDVNKWKVKTPIISHTRSKTFGDAKLINAHPFLYYKEKKEEDYYKKNYLNEDNHGKNIVHTPVPDFVMAMNGSLDQLYNGTLQKKYGINFIYGENDSKMLGGLLFQHGFNVLLDYQGDAALAMAFPKEKEYDLILWSGASKPSETELTQRERPLHYYFDKEDDGIYFSSLAEHLKFISNNREEITEVPVNTLLYFKEGVIVKEEIYDRSLVVKKETYYHKNTVTHHSAYPVETKTKSITLPSIRHKINHIL